jgi:hypothetical protein
LNGVASLGPSDVWAVGNTSSGAGRTLSEHWDGTAWTTFPSPQIGGDLERFNAVVTTPGGNVWAAGSRNGYLGTLVERLCPIKVRDSGFSPTATNVPQGSSVAWSFPDYNATDHTVTDDSGMGMFDSGAVSGGGSFVEQFLSAGTFPIADSTTLNTSSISVPVLTSAAPGLHAVVTWARITAPTDFVYDIQVRRPGTANFVAWRTGVTAKTGVYTASVAGSYRFRARLRQVSSGAFSDWSPVRTFFIS